MRKAVRGWHIAGEIPSAFAKNSFRPRRHRDWSSRITPSLEIETRQRGGVENHTGGNYRVKLAFQIPLKSGFPSRPRGAGADRSALPSAVLGILADGWLIHCPKVDTAARKRMHAAFINRFKSNVEKTERVDPIVPLRIRHHWCQKVPKCVHAVPQRTLVSAD